MQVLVIGNQLKRSRLAKLLPDFSLDRSMLQLAASTRVAVTRRADITVGSDGLYSGGHKLAGSRLGAWQLRQLGIIEVRLALSDAALPEQPAELPDSSVFVGALTFLANHQESARELFSFVDIGSEEGKLSLARSPLAKSEDIYRLINSASGTQTFRLEVARILKSRGQFFLDKLEPAVWLDVYPLLGKREQEFLTTMALQHLKVESCNGSSFIRFLEKTGRASQPEVLSVIEAYEKRAESFPDPLALR